MICTKHNFKSSYLIGIIFRPKDGTQTGATTLGQSRPGSNANKVVQHTSPELEPQQQMQLSVIPKLQSILAVNQLRYIKTCFIYNTERMKFFHMEINTFDIYSLYIYIS